MAYCTDDEVSSEFKDIVFSATSPVTDTEVTEFVSQASAEIDSIISNRYTTPVTGTESLKVLKQICIWLVKARIVGVLRIKNVSDKSDQDVGSLNYRKEALDRLKNIAIGKEILTDAPRSNTTGGLTSYLKDLDVTYDFQVGVDQW